MSHQEAILLKIPTRQTRGLQMAATPQDFEFQGRQGDEGEKQMVRLQTDGNSNRHDAGIFFLKRIIKDSAVLKNHPEAEPHQQRIKWQKLKKLSLPVLPTFRLDDSGEYLISSDATVSKKFQIFDANHKMPNEIHDQIPNLEEIKQQLRDIARTAYQDGQGVYLSFDAYALGVDDDGQVKVFLLDLGIGSHLLENGKSVHVRYDLSWDRAEEEVEDFISQVIEGRADTQEMFFGG